MAKPKLSAEERTVSLFLTDLQIERMRADLKSRQVRWRLTRFDLITPITVIGVIVWLYARAHSGAVP